MSTHRFVVATIMWTIGMLLFAYLYRMIVADAHFDQVHARDSFSTASVVTSK